MKRLTAAIALFACAGVGALVFFKHTEGNVFGAIQFDSAME